MIAPYERKAAQPLAGCAAFLPSCAGRRFDRNRIPDYLVGTVLIVFTIRATIW